MKEYITVQESAYILNVSSSYVTKQIETGVFKNILISKSGKTISKSEVVALIKSMKQKADKGLRELTALSQEMCFRMSLNRLLPTALMDATLLYKGSY